MPSEAVLTALHDGQIALYRRWAGILEAANDRHLTRSQAADEDRIKAELDQLEEAIFGDLTGEQPSFE